MSSKWKKYTVGDLVDMGMLEKPLDGNHGGIHPKSNDYKSTGIPFIMANDLRNGTVDYDNCKFISKEQYSKLKKGKSIPGDVLLTHKATLGRTAIVSDKFDEIVLTPQVTFYRVKKGMCNMYLKYYFDSDFFQGILNSWASSGSTRSYLGITQQLKLPIILPPYEEQKEISSLLEALDNMIENGGKINKVLEELTQTLFKRWFVDFEFPNEDGKPYKSNGGKMVESEMGLIPEGWSTPNISDLEIFITDYVSNGSFASLKENVTLYQDKEYAYFIRNTDLKKKSFGVYVDRHSYEFLSKSALYGDEIIISNVGDVGSVYLCPKMNGPMTLGNNIIMIKPLHDNEFLRYYLYILFKWSYGSSLIDSITGGSAQPKFNKTNFKDLRIVLPSKMIQDSFERIIREIFEKIKVNDKIEENLLNIKNSILPKLMSGEIRVPIDKD